MVDRRLLYILAIIGMVSASSDDDDYDDDNYSKAQGYGLGYACAYFLGLVFVVYCLDVSGYYDKHVKTLSEYAFRSHESNKRAVERISEEYQSAKMGSGKLKRLSITKEKRENIISESNKEVKAEVQEILKKNSCDIYGCIVTLFTCWFSYCCNCKRLLWIDDDPWTADFTASLLEGKSFYGCNDDVLPGGLLLSKTSGWNPFGFDLRLPLGLFEDFLFNFYNTDHIAAMFLSTRGHPVSRRARRAAFLIQASFAFLMVCLMEFSCEGHSFTHSLTHSLTYSLTHSLR